jgi:hypothetical protein
LLDFSSTTIVLAAKIKGKQSLFRSLARFYIKVRDNGRKAQYVVNIFIAGGHRLWYTNAVQGKSGECSPMYDDILARILEPDIFLPSQFYGSGSLSRKLEGEKRLMIAILKDAVECLEKFRTSSSSSGRSHYLNALEWVQDENTEWLFSFTNICDLLGFDPDYLREVLLKRENKYVKPVQTRVLSFAAMSAQ